MPTRLYCAIFPIQDLIQAIGAVKRVMTKENLIDNLYVKP